MVRISLVSAFYYNFFSRQVVIYYKLQ